MNARKRVRCIWTYDDSTDSWDTGCGEKWTLINGTPRENGMKYCHGCGLPLTPKEILINLNEPWGNRKDLEKFAHFAKDHSRHFDHTFNKEFQKIFGLIFEYENRDVNWKWLASLVQDQEKNDYTTRLTEALMSDLEAVINDTPHAARMAAEVWGPETMIAVSLNILSALAFF